MAGVVEGYNLNVQPGDHIWRIRQRKGPATNFTTNFLSDVQGHIEVGQTLFFVTQQFANGVKVITSPLENLYKGTASVSGAICNVPVEPEKASVSFVTDCDYVDGQSINTVEMIIANATLTINKADYSSKMTH